MSGLGFRMRIEDLPCVCVPLKPLHLIADDWFPTLGSESQSAQLHGNGFVRWVVGNVSLASM
jgi:hypothetical protein